MMADPQSPSPPTTAPETKPLPEKIRGWLEMNGYPLEMRVAGAFQDAGYMVEQSFYYSEERTTHALPEPRELDVIAQHYITIEHAGEKVIAAATAFVECKSNARAKRPWVMFSSPVRSNDPFLSGKYHLFNRQAQHVLEESRGNVNVVNHAALVVPPRIGYSLISPPIGEKEKGTDRDKEDRQDLAYNALLKLAHASYTMTERAYDAAGLAFGFPVIAVATPLHECWLEQGGIKIEERKHMQLLWQRPVGTTHNPFVIHVVHVDEMPAFAARVKDLIATVEREATDLISTISAAARASKQRASDSLRAKPSTPNG